MTTTEKESNQEEPNNLKNQLVPLLEGILYPSESDEPITFFEVMPEEQELIIEADNVAQILGMDVECEVEEISSEDFFYPICTLKDWYGEEEKQGVERAVTVQKVVQETLSNLHAYRLGETEITLVLLGQDADKNWKGLKTLLIET